MAPTDRPSDPSPEAKPDKAAQDWVEYRLQRDFKEQLKLRLLEAFQMGARMHFREALSIESVPRDQILPEELHARFASRYVAPRIARAIVEACLGNPQAFNAVRQEVNAEGGLIEPKDEAEFARRVADSDHWVIAEASGLHPDPDSLFHSDRVPSADCQCVLPDDREDAQWVVPLLRPGIDTIYDPELDAKIRNAKPAAVGLIDQIAVNKEFAHLRLAAHARHDALTQVVQREREHPIEHMIGMAFCIQGVELADGAKFLLKDYDQKSLVNMISLLMNEHSTRCPAQVVGRYRGQHVPVSFVLPGGTETVNGFLLVDWYYLDHQTEHIHLPGQSLPKMMYPKPDATSGTSASS